MTALEFKLPDIGEGVHEGEIVRWIVAEGAAVQEDEPVVEVMTDKATVEVPAPGAAHTPSRQRWPSSHSSSAAHGSPRVLGREKQAASPSPSPS
ncbi:MAG: biotin/lipoyl-containing protein, partial [Planctomycetota bacterium]